MAEIAEVTVTVKNPGAFERHLENVVQGIVANYIQQKSQELILRVMAEIGKPAAEGAYGVDEEGGAILVTMEKIPKGWKLVANGEAVGFLEFGAGVSADTGHHFAGNAPFEVKPASWSKTHSQQFYKNGEWWFGGKRYTGIQARRGLYLAYTVMLKDLRRIAIEVFNT